MYPGTGLYPPIGIKLILSTPPAITQSAIPDLIFALARAIVSRPDAQYLLTVTPGTSSIFNPIRDINLPTFKPCSASGIALPTMISSIVFLSNPSILLIMYSIVSAANSSGLLNLKKPLGALPTAVL